MPFVPEFDLLFFTKLTQPKVINAFVYFSKPLAAFLAQGLRAQCNCIQQNSMARHSRHGVPPTSETNRKGML